MPSVQSTLIRAQIKMLHPILKRLDILGERKTQDAFGELGSRVLSGKIEYVSEPFDNFEADWACPVKDAEQGAILYLHGGSYTAGSLGYAKGFGGVFADAVKKNTLCVAYRLAPEHPYPAAVDDALGHWLQYSFFLGRRTSVGKAHIAAHVACSSVIK